MCKHVHAILPKALYNHVFIHSFMSSYMCLAACWSRLACSQTLLVLLMTHPCVYNIPPPSRHIVSVEVCYWKGYRISSRINSFIYIII